MHLVISAISALFFIMHVYGQPDMNLRSQLRECRNLCQLNQEICNNRCFSRIRGWCNSARQECDSAALCCLSECYVAANLEQWLVSRYPDIYGMCKRS